MAIQRCQAKSAIKLTRLIKSTIKMVAIKLTQSKRCNQIDNQIDAGIVAFSACGLWPGLGSNGVSIGLGRARCRAIKNVCKV